METILSGSRIFAAIKIYDITGEEFAGTKETKQPLTRRSRDFLPTLPGAAVPAREKFPQFYRPKTPTSFYTYISSYIFIIRIIGFSSNAIRFHKGGNKNGAFC